MCSGYRMSVHLGLFMKEAVEQHLRTLNLLRAKWVSGSAVEEQLIR